MYTNNTSMVVRLKLIIVIKYDPHLNFIHRTFIPVDIDIVFQI